MKKNMNYNVGLRIQELRKQRNLSQEQLALRSNITPSYLGQLERNQKNPTIKVVEQLCDGMNMTLQEFFSSNLSITYDDSYDLQILAQISNCTESEKKHILRIIKDILRFKKHEAGH